MKDIYWADLVAEDIIKRKKYNYLNKKISYPKTLIVKSSTSISGVPHIGNASDVLRHDAVVRSLKNKKKSAKLIWVAEDMDALRKIPAGLPSKLSKYLGIPVADVPCPYDCCKSYSEHFCNLFVKSLKNNFGTKPEYISTAEAYRTGKFTKYIKKILNNLDLVKEIVQKSYKNPLPKNWNPWKPVCEKCGKLMTTQVTKTIKDKVEYVCKDYEFKDHVKGSYTKLKGCGHKGISNLKNGKLLWRVEWAMLWKHWDIIFEGAGKEHFVSGAPFWTAGEICEKVFNWPEPYPGKNPLQPYAYLSFEGKKMSASLGNVVATWDWPKFAPPEVLRLIFIRKPSRPSDFRYQDIPRLCDEIDRLEKNYFDKKGDKKLKRLFELVSVKVPKKNRKPISFGLLATMSQLYDDFKDAAKKLDKIGYKVIDKKFTKIRFEQAKVWLDKYGPEEVKFEVYEKLPRNIKLDKKQKEALLLLSKKLSKKYTEKSLFDEFYNICNKIGIKNTEFFEGAYLALIARKKGPRLASLILAIGRDKVRKILKQFQ